MQKARCHHTRWLQPLAGAWFQVLFHSPVRGSFHLSLTVLCAIGLSVVFSLSGWSPIIRPEFLVFRLTQVAVLAAFSSVTGLSPSLARHSSRFSSITSAPLSAPITPARALRHRRFGLFPVRSPLLGESLLLSLPVGTKMFQFPTFASSFEDEGIAPSGLPHSDICGSRCICHSPQLFAACHVLLRLREPRHPPCALSRSVNIFLTSRLNDMCLFALWLLVCETLLCFYSCLLTIQNSKCNIQNFKSFPALSLFSEKWRITDSNR